MGKQEGPRCFEKKACMAGTACRAWIVPTHFAQPNQRSIAPCIVLLFVKIKSRWSDTGIACKSSKFQTVLFVNVIPLIGPRWTYPLFIGHGQRVFSTNKRRKYSIIIIMSTIDAQKINWWFWENIYVFWERVRDVSIYVYVIWHLKCLITKWYIVLCYFLILNYYLNISAVIMTII
jgi:hypothetical protein